MAMEDLQDIVYEARVKFTSRKIICGGIALVALLIIILLLAVIILGTRDCGGTTMQDYCMEPACLQSASFVTKNRDVTINPCEDFYKYACQGWLKNADLHKNFGESSILGHVAEDNEQKWRSIMERPTSITEVPTSEHKLKDFFHHCIHDFEHDNGGADLVNAILTNLGGWYVLDPQNWNANWNMDQAVINTHMEFLVGIHFEYDLLPDPTGAPSIINIKPETIGLSVDAYSHPNLAMIRTGYKNYIKTIGGLLLRDANVTLTSSERNSRLETFANDVMTHEGRLAQYRSQSKDAKIRTTLGELAKNFTQIHWVEIMSSVFPKYSSSTTVEVDNLGFFRILDSALRDEGINRDRILNNFMVWSITRNYIDSLSWEYRNARNDFEMANEISASYDNTWKICMDLTKSHLTYAMIAMFANRHVDKTSSPEDVEKMVNDLRSFAVKKVSELKWMDDQTKAMAKHKLSKMEVTVGFPKLMKDKDKFDTFYDRLKVNTSVSFFKTLLNAKKFLAYQHSRMEDDKDSSWLWEITMQHKGMGIEPVYYEEFNRMLVPPGSMVFPIFDIKMPKAMAYGGMGYFIGQRLVNAFDSEVRFTTNDLPWHMHGSHLSGRYFAVIDNSWWTDVTKAAYNNATKCLSDFYKEKKAGPYLVDGEYRTIDLVDVGTEPAAEVLGRLYGLQIAFQTYQANAMNIPKQLLPGVNLTQQQLFFVSAAQLQCNTRPDIESYLELIRGSLPKDILVNTIMATNPDFHKAFNCPDNSPLKPKTFCPLV